MLIKSPTLSWHQSFSPIDVQSIIEHQLLSHVQTYLSPDNFQSRGSEVNVFYRTLGTRLCKKNKTGESWLLQSFNYNVSSYTHMTIVTDIFLQLSTIVVTAWPDILREDWQIYLPDVKPAYITSAEFQLKSLIANNCSVNSFNCD